jgi:Fe2+ transport system protein FeoA
MKTAAHLNFGEKGIIDSIDSSHPSFRRIIEIGFTPGQEIELINKSLFNDPLAFALRGTMIAIRKNEAESIKLL